MGEFKMSGKNIKINKEKIEKINEYVEKNFEYPFYHTIGSDGNIKPEIIRMRRNRANCR